jgi:nucleotide-binding universal stress UspA family protein
MYERILVALDGSELAERVLPHVEALAKAFGSTLILLQATTSPAKLIAELSGAEVDITPAIMDPTEILEEEQQEVGEYLAGAAARLKAAGWTVQTDEPEGDPADTIVKRAAELEADLIAMTTHGRSGFGKLIFGSVAESVLHHARCPVLLVRVHEE